MTIEWNKVTWYSKIIAIVLFAGIFFLGFLLGMMNAEKVYVEVPHIVNHLAQPQAAPQKLYRNDQYGFSVDLQDGYIIDAVRRGEFILKKPEANFLVYDPQKEPKKELHGNTQIDVYDGINIALYSETDSQELKKQVQLEINHWKDNPEIFEAKSAYWNSKMVAIFRLSSVSGPYSFVYVEGQKNVYILTTRDYDLSAFLKLFTLK